MIQRIQTVFLAIAVLWGIAIVIADPAMLTLTASDAVYVLKNLGLFSLTGIENLLPAYPVIATLAFCIIIPGFAIFKFKNRKFQMKLVRLGMILQLAYVGLIVFYMDRANALIGEETDVQGSIWLYTVLVPIICSFLANRFIKKDDDMVRAADRLR